MFRMRFKENMALNYIILAALLATIATIYIPFINTAVFMQWGLSWQWGAIAAGQVIFLSVAELYKLWKRRSTFWNPPDATPTGVQLGEGDEPEREEPEEGFVKYEQRMGSKMSLPGQDVEMELNRAGLTPVATASSQ